MKRKLTWFGVTVLALAVLVVAGPRYVAEIDVAPVPAIGDADEYVTSVESKVSDIWRGAEKRIVWFSEDRSRTDRVIVYVHGFSATRREVAPLCDSLAARLGANLFYTRLAGHGRPAASLATVTVSDWLFDIREALAVAEELGDRIVMVATSTGGTLAVWAVSGGLTEEETRNVEALILMSPNFGPADRRSNMVLMPWGMHLTRLMIGDMREWKPHNALQARHWTTRYPVEAVFPVMASVRAVRNIDPSGFRRPVLVAYSPYDTVLDTARILAWYDAIGSDTKVLLPVMDAGDPSAHVLAGDILSPGTTERMSREIQTFLEGL